MTIRLTAALILLSLPLAASQQARGAVTSLTVAPDVSVGVMRFVVRGTNPCGAVHLDYGDGNGITHAIRDLPVSIEYEYTRTGRFTARASGMGNCDGARTAAVRVTAVRPQPPPPPPTPTPTPRPTPPTRPDRPAWQSPTGGSARPAAGINDWTERQFRQLDRNADNRLSLSEFLAGSRQSAGDSVGFQDQIRDDSRAILVSSRVPWTDTGIDVRAGDVLTIRATGTIQFSAASGDIAPPDGAQGRRATSAAPLSRDLIGALIARVGGSDPFVVGASPRAFRATASGRLYLGVNDDLLTDNRGDFRVTIAVSRSNTP
jgi:hypothetical protein